jgi:hypothetical protein
MWTRWSFSAAAICLASAPQASSAGILHRASCSMVRLYVAAPAAEAWARSKGATDAEIEAARLCLKSNPVQTVMLSSTAH